MPKSKTSWTDFPDVNVLLALIFDGHQHHVRAREWFDDVADGGSALCRVTQMGLLRLLTNSAVMAEAVLSQKQAWGVYDLLRSDARWVFLNEGGSLEGIWRKLTQSKLKGDRRWTDGYLAAFAQVHSLRLVTFDRGFKNFKKLEHVVLS